MTKETEITELLEIEIVRKLENARDQLKGVRSSVAHYEMQIAAWEAVAAKMGIKWPAERK